MNKTNRVMLSLLLTGVASLVAVTGIGSYRADAANSGSINFSVDLQSSATVSIQNAITSLQVTPSSVGTFRSADVPVTAYSNSPAGYTLTMTTKTNDTFNSNLVNSEDSTITIPTLPTPAFEGGYVTSYDGESAPENYFPSNYWGVAVDTGNYFPATENFVIKETSDRTDAGSNGGSATTVHLGTKVDLLATAGTYNTTVVFSVTANRVIPTYMQDATAADFASVGDSLVLKDKRDEQEYTVTKLADGKVWMTKNLNLAGGKALSADDTDVDSTYISGFTTQAGLTKDNNTITLPASATITSGTSVDSTQFSSDTTAYVFNSGNTTCSSSSPCYSYYSWLTATLGGKQANGSTAVSDYYNAAASICPKGWRLPTSTTSNAKATTRPNWKTGDFYALATAYGANLASNYYDISSSTGENFYNNAGPSTTPNFLLTGSYDGGSFDEGGSRGFSWSSTSSSSAFAYSLNFNSSGVYSANGSGRRRIGFGVRCILRES